MATQAAKKPQRTIDQPTSGEPAQFDGFGTLVKPGELVDIIEMTPLTLNDRRIYNCLLANAWDKIGEDVEHQVKRSALRPHDGSTAPVGASIERLMAAIVRVRLPNDKTLRVQLLGANTESGQGSGFFTYRFDPELRKIIRNSNVFARIRSEVTFALSSKYALALYEMIQKRGNLAYKQSETFELDELRLLLGVAPGKLTEFSDFKRRALKPAVTEVNALGDFGVAMLPVKTRHAVTHVQISWHEKSVDELKAAYQELQRSRVGRKARIGGNVEHVDFEKVVIR